MRCSPWVTIGEGSCARCGVPDGEVRCCCRARSALGKNLSTPTTRAFWAHAEHVAAKVRTWPAWKRVGVVLRE